MQIITGIGGLKASARWHTRGHRIVYLSSTPASALLEILVHLEIEEGHLPRFYKLLEIQVPDDVRIEKLEDWAKLPKGWPEEASGNTSAGRSMAGEEFRSASGDSFGPCSQDQQLSPEPTSP